MSESDTMINEWDRRCAAVQVMLSTDPSYDNTTLDSTLKMQIWIAMNNRGMPRVMKTKFPATVIVFGVVSSEGYIMPPHIFEVSLKVNTKVYLDVLKSVMIPWCNQVAWVWQQDLAPAHKSKRDLGSASEGVLQLCTLLSLLPPSWTCWTTSFAHMSRTSPTWPPTTPKPAGSPPSAIRRVFAKLPPALVEKACSQFWICIEAVIEAEGGYIE